MIILRLDVPAIQWSNADRDSVDLYSFDGYFDLNDQAARPSNPIESTPNSPNPFAEIEERRRSQCQADIEGSLVDWAIKVLLEADPHKKVALTKCQRCGRLEKSKHWLWITACSAKEESRIAILHSLANIEQWAIDLAFDIIARFSSFTTSTHQPLPRAFFTDFLKVATDEAKHRLSALNTSFGDLQVHGALWDSATATMHSLPARLAIVYMVHEARGLDVNLGTIEKCVF
ncbi:hypothetical protein HDV05_000076 [Chytridiales sp. JEL 0842]|nr:hypothetical protein HDV05_000076 [Chytridiales sp. JEL 0842]